MPYRERKTVVLPSHVSRGSRLLCEGTILAGLLYKWPAAMPSTLNLKGLGETVNRSSSSTAFKMYLKFSRQGQNISHGLFEASQWQGHNKYRSPKQAELSCIR